MSVQLRDILGETTSLSSETYWTVNMKAALSNILNMVEIDPPDIVCPAVALMHCGIICSIIWHCSDRNFCYVSFVLTHAPLS